MRSHIFALALAAVGLAGPAAAREDAVSWRLVTRAEVIVVATPVFPDQPPPPRTYVEIPLREATVLKGEDSTDLTIRWYSEARSYAPQPAQLAAASGAPAIVFGVHADGQLYFAGSTPEALAPATPETIAAVGEEIAEQRRLLAAWRPDRSVPHYAEVREIIDAIAVVKAPTRAERRAASDAGADRQQALFDQLIALGPDAVPAIITLMDDDRRLPRPAISLVNEAPDAFEGLRHYGPDVLTEALAAVLNQITGEDFGFIYNGASAAERRRAVDGWRIYLMKQATT